MSMFFSFLLVQIALGLFDNLYHHEYKEALPSRQTAWAELFLHSAREFIYGVVFLGLAWLVWEGGWAWFIAALFFLEVGITITDFIVEDATRRLPRLERATHTVLAINYGVLLALFAPYWLAWADGPTRVSATDYGVFSWILTLCGVGVLAFSVRNAYAAASHVLAMRQRIPLLPFYHNPDSKRVLVTGATGFIGRHLVKDLVRRGHRVVVYARNPGKASSMFGRQITVVSDLHEIPAKDQFHAFINLAGEPVAGWWWTKRRKEKLLNSRLQVTKALHDLAARLHGAPKTWINASAVGYYGVRNDDVPLHEKASPQNIFQSRLCQRWEQEALRARALGTAVAILRIGLVLGADGGMFPKLARPVRLGVGAIFGSGSQWMSWIHVDDLLRLINFVLDQSTLAGPMNAVAPTPVTHDYFMKALARRLGRWLLPFGIPASLLRLALGEMSQLMVEGQRVVPERATALGFRFRYTDLDAAFASLIPNASTSPQPETGVEVPCPE